MKKEIGPVAIILALILVAGGLGMGVYLMMRPEPVNIRKGVPWEDRMKRSAPGPGATRMPAPPPPHG